jgi:hypothetical protein
LAHPATDVTPLDNTDFFRIIIIISITSILLLRAVAPQTFVAGLCCHLPVPHQQDTLFLLNAAIA